MGHLMRRLAIVVPLLLSPTTVAVGQPLEPPAFQLVDAQTAGERLRVHQRAVEDRLANMATLFDTGAKATLVSAFEQRNVDELAMGYADAWSGNSVYLTWVNSLRPFYYGHLETLKQSLRAIEASGYAAEIELDYIDRGVAAWLDEETHVAAQMQTYVDLLAEYAFHLGNRMRTTSDPRYYVSSTPPEERTRLHAEADHHAELADQVSTGEIEGELQASGQRRLFSSIEGVDSNDALPDPPLFDETLADACPFIEISDPPAVPQPPEGELVPYAEAYFPDFVGKPWVNDAVAKWRGVVQQLSDLMSARPSRDRLQELVRWQAQRDRLLGELVLAEEDVVWKLPGSHFTAAEVATLQPGFVRLARARERAGQLAQNEVKVAELHETLASYEEFYNTIQQRFTTGDQDFFLAAGLSMAHAQCSDRLRRVEGVSDALRREITEAITELSGAFAQVVQSRRNRGLEELDRLRAAEAAATGDPPPPPFRVHRPATRKEYDDLARIMSERFSKLVSGGVPMQFPGGSSRAFFDLPSDRVAALSQAEIDRLTR